MAAKDAAQLSLVPVRVLVAMLLGFAAYYLPWLALAGWMLVFGGAVGMIVAFWLLHRLMRWRGRVPCAHCGHSVLRIAKYCPQCAAPTLIPGARAASPQCREAMARAAIAMVHVDKSVSDTERAYLTEAVRLGGFEASVAAQLTASIHEGVSVDDVRIEALTKRERADVVRAAAAAMVSDKVVTLTEEAALTRLGNRAGIGRLGRWWISRSFRRSAITI